MASSKTDMSEEHVANTTDIAHDDVDASIAASAAASRAAVSSFNAAATRYHELRPSYPHSIIAACTMLIANAVRTAPNVQLGTVLELGAGSGILSRLLLTAAADIETNKDIKDDDVASAAIPPNPPLVILPTERRDGIDILRNIPSPKRCTNCTSSSTHYILPTPKWIASDPSSGMLDVLRKQLNAPDAPKLRASTCANTSIDVRCMAADNLDGLANGSISAIVAGQCAHWFATANAIKEIARVLRPGGIFILVWNTDNVQIPFVNDVKAVSNTYDHTMPQYRLGAWYKGLFGSSIAHDNFDLPLYHVRFTNDVVASSVDAAFETIFTKSYIIQLDDATKNTIRQQTHDIRKRHEEEIQKNTKPDGSFIYPFVTDMYFTFRK